MTNCLVVTSHSLPAIPVVPKVQLRTPNQARRQAIPKIGGMIKNYSIETVPSAAATFYAHEVSINPSMRRQSALD